MKKFSYIFLALSLLLTGCYKDEIAQIEKEIETLRNTEIAPLSSQVKEIDKSIKSLDVLSEEMKEYTAKLTEISIELQIEIGKISNRIEEVRTELLNESSSAKEEVLTSLENVKSALEVQLENVNSTLTTLSEKSASLELQTSNLKAFADSVYASKDWVNGTFATIAKQNEIMADVVSVKAQIAAINSTSAKIKEEILSLIDNDVPEMVEGLQGDIANKVYKVSTECSAAVTKMVQDLTDAYTKSLEDAVEKSVEKLKAWVNDQLTDYYKVIDAEAAIAAFKAIAGNVPAGSSLQGQISALETVLAETFKKIGEDYKIYITDAIENSEGKITYDMEQQILKLRSEKIAPIISDVDQLEKDVDSILSDLASYAERIKTLDGQAAAIQKSLKVLDSLKCTLEEYVEMMRLEMATADAENYKALKGQIDALDAYADNTIGHWIDSLNTFLGTLPAGEKDIVTWISTTKETIENQFKTLYKLSDFEKFKEATDDTLEAHQTQIDFLSDELDKVIAKGKTTVEGWVDAKLVNYKTASELHDTLNIIRADITSMFGAGDKQLNDNLAALNTRLNSAVSDLTEAYQKAIEDAITNGGLVTDVIRNAVKSADSRVAALRSDVAQLYDDVDAIQQQYDAVKADVDDAESKISDLRTFIYSGLDTTIYTNLTVVLDSLDKRFKKLDRDCGSLADLNNLTTQVNSFTEELAKLAGIAEGVKAAEDYLAGLNEFLATPEGKQIADLKSYIDEMKGKMVVLDTLVRGQNGIKNTLALLQTRLYGKTGGSLTDYTSSSIWGKLDTLKGKILSASSKFTTISYIPESSDGTAKMTYNSNKYSVTFKFLISPASVFESINTYEGFKMKYTSTPKRKADVVYDFESTSCSYSSGVLTVTAYSTTSSAFSNGASAALYVNVGEYDFVSEFVPITLVDGARDFYVYPETIEFDALGDTLSVNVATSSTYSRTSWSSNKEEWILKVNPSSGTGSKEVSIILGPNTSGDQRVGTVTFSMNAGGSLGTLTRTLTVTQKGRDQKFTEDSPSPKSLTFTFNGKVVSAGKATDDKEAEVTAETNDKLHDWTIDPTSVENWLNGTHSSENNKATFKTVKNNNSTTEDRVDTVVFKSVSGDTCHLVVTQLKRDQEQTLEFNPDTLRFLFNGKKYGEATKDTAKFKVITNDGETDWTIVGKTGSLFDYERDGETSDMVTIKNVKSSKDAGYVRRTDTVKFKSATKDTIYKFVVVQMPRGEQTLELDDTLKVTSGGAEAAGAKVVKVTSSDGETDWTCPTGNLNDWLKAERPDAEKNKVKFTIKKNNTNSERTYDLIFKNYAGNNVDTLHIVQAPLTVTIVDTVYISQNGQKYSVDGINWTSRYSRGSYTAISISAVLSHEAPSGPGPDDPKWTVSKDPSATSWLNTPTLSDRGVNRNISVSTTNGNHVNNSVSARECALLIKYGTTVISKCVIKQLPKINEVKSLTPENILFNYSGQEYSTDGGKTWDYCTPHYYYGLYIDYYYVPMTITMAMEGDTDFVVTEEPGVEWMIRYDSSSNNVINISVKPTTEERSVVIRVSNKAGTQSKTCTVTQQAPQQTISSISPSTIIFNYNGSKYKTSETGEWKDSEYWDDEGGYNTDIHVTIEGDYESGWTAEKVGTVDWIKNIYVSEDEKIASVFPAVNNTEGERSCTIRIYNFNKTNYKDCTVKQQASDPSIKSISPSTLIFSADAQRYSINNGETFTNVSRSGDRSYYYYYGTVTVDTENPGWSLQNPQTWGSSDLVNNGDNTLRVKTKAAITSWDSGKRTGSVTIKAASGNTSADLTIIQNRPLTVVLPANKTQYNNRTFTITVKSDASWSYGNVSGSKSATIKKDGTTITTSDSISAGETTITITGQDSSSATRAKFTDASGSTRTVKIVRGGSSGNRSYTISLE